MAQLARLAPLVLLPLALSATGCGKVREIKECRALSREVSAALDQVEALSKEKPKDPEQTLRIAGHYGALAKALSPRGDGPTPLAAAVRDYAELMRSTEEALQAHAEALRAGDTKGANETRRELERIVKRERAAIVRLEAECRV